MSREPSNWGLLTDGQTRKQITAVSDGGSGYALEVSIAGQGAAGGDLNVADSQVLAQLEDMEADLEAINTSVQAVETAVEAPYDSVQDANRVAEVDPLNEKAVTETLVDTTNIAAADNYYPSSAGASMEGFDAITFGIEVSGGVTVTIEARLNTDAAWQDVTASFLDLTDNSTGNASWVDTNAIAHSENLNVGLVRLKAVTADATNALTITLRRNYA